MRSSYHELTDVELDCLYEDEQAWNEGWGPRPSPEEEARAWHEAVREEQERAAFLASIEPDLDDCVPF
jgi:hypothetical protein